MRLVQHLVLLPNGTLVVLFLCSESLALARACSSGSNSFAGIWYDIRFFSCVVDRFGPGAVGDDPSRAVTLLRESLEEMGEVRRGFIKLAVLDHITSNTALLLPVRELTEVRVSFCALCANFALTLR